jgi:uncharacterized membrane protein
MSNDEGDPDRPDRTRGEMSHPDAGKRDEAGEGGGTDGSATVDERDADGLLLGRGLFESQMGPGSSLAHLYRAEVHRMKLWRERLDRTTNWAVVLMAAILTWAFSSEGNPHYLLLVGVAAVTVFLLMEARRYRGYDIWRSRVRLLQENVLAVGLDETLDPPDPDWRERLSRDFLSPTMKLTAEQSVAHRLRRVYLPLLAVLVAAWVVRITAFADAAWPASAAVGTIPGQAVTAVVGAFVLALVVIAYRPREWRGELLEADTDEWNRQGED